MFVEFTLDAYNEDPVNLIVVRLKDRNDMTGADPQDTDDPGEDVYVVEHIFESRGGREVKQTMEVRVMSEYTGE